MKKIIKKLIAVTLTLVMVLAMSVPTLAAENTLTVKVKLDSSINWSKCSLYYWTNSKFDYVAWPGSEMTKSDDGYTLDIKVDGDTVNLIVDDGQEKAGKQTKDIKDVSTSKGTVVITVDKDLNTTVTYETGTVPTGDTTTVVPYVILAVVAGCGITYTAKKRVRA